MTREKTLFILCILAIIFVVGGCTEVGETTSRTKIPECEEHTGYAKDECYLNAVNENPGAYDKMICYRIENLQMISACRDLIYWSGT